MMAGAAARARRKGCYGDVTGETGGAGLAFFPQSQGESAMMSGRLAICLAPGLLLLLGACEGLENFARDVDSAAATIIPTDHVTTPTDPERTYRLGLAYLNGDGVRRDEEKAAALFQEAAEKGSRDAAYQLGLMYQRGTGVAQHDGTALAWMEKAAALGHADAQLLTGQAYATGRGTARDPAWAARWYGKAADQGLAAAQHLLGMAYATGQGLPRDRVAAATWLGLAAAQKDENAMRERKALTTQMSKAEIDQADRRVRAWQRAGRNPSPNDQPSVRFAQVALTDLGYDVGPVDGQLGPRTRQALSDYQGKVGLLPSDGRLNPVVLERLKIDRVPGSTLARSAR
jgi:TPR repeat protein